MSLPLMPFDGLNETLLHAEWHGYISFGASTLVFWDHILTFDRELELIWRQPKSGVSVLFLFNRYLAMTSQPVMTYTNISTNITYEASRSAPTFTLKLTSFPSMFQPVHFTRKIDMIDSYLDLGKFAIAYWQIGTSILQLVLTDSIVWLCLCALYKNSKKIRWPLLGLMTLCILSATAIVGVTGSHSKGSVDLAPGVQRCTVYTPLHGLWLFWIPILVYETTTLALVNKIFIQYLRNRKQWSSNLLELLVKDMLLYLAVILVLFVSNAIFFANPDPTISGTLNPPTVVLLSILGNRMLLNLRAETKRAKTGVVYEDTRQEADADARILDLASGVGTAGIGLESTMRFGPPAEQSQISTTEQ
ncbi:hypothetical protein BDP27DRAFT_1420998 [Rhodocollybia butyracea]|uniref:DUF6533 domain-containing protein n=1 Tax=Rhodocollybia butyracea TaxID=206335 RepID=A0A9P5PUG5_9AGAR|nr:hypothetical protein BDP27DRAFT_1420998 [Rhodocollybia butyracea]